MTRGECGRTCGGALTWLLHHDVVVVVAARGEGGLGLAVRRAW